MAGVLLDATVVIEYLRQSPDIVDRVERLLDSGDVAYTCAIVVEETIRGLRTEEEGRARSLFSGLRDVPLGTREGWRAGTWRRDFAKRGVTLSQADCLIAAAAVSIGARLATANVKDFPMPEITVEAWGRS